MCMRERVALTPPLALLNLVPDMPLALLNLALQLARQLRRCRSCQKLLPLCLIPLYVELQHVGLLCSLPLHLWL